MKTNFRGYAGRIISFILVVVMVMSMWTIGIVPTSAADVNLSESGVELGADSLSSTGTSGTSGDATLFDTAVTTEPYLKVEKSSFDIDTPVLVTAKNGKRLALYKESVTSPSSSDKAIYTYNLSGHEGETIDIRTGTYNSSSGVKPYLEDGKFKVFLFVDDGYTVGASATVTIKNGNRNAVSGTDAVTYLESNRKVYRYGEPIVVKANASNNPNAWIGLYKIESGESYSDSIIKTKPPRYMLYIGSNYSGNKARTNTDLIANSVVNKGAEALKGDFYLVLVSDKNPMTASVLGSLSVKIRYGVVTSDKSTYGIDEDIITNVDVFDSSDFSISNGLIVAGNASGSYKGDSLANSVTSLMSRCYGYAAQTTAPATSGNLAGTWVVSGDKLTLSKTSGGSTYNRPYAYLNTNTSWLKWVQPNVNRDSGSDVKIYGTLTAAGYLYSTTSTTTTKPSSKVVDYQFPKGTPYVYLEYANASYYKVQIGGYTGYIYYGAGFTAKTNAYINQEFQAHGTATAYDSNRSASLHTYVDGEDPSASNFNSEYTLTSSTKNSYVYQDKVGKSIDAGTYKLYLMRNNSYSSYTNKTINVTSTSTAKFGNGAYQVNDLDDGFANGKVALQVSTTASYGYHGKEGMVAHIYWAGSDKAPLEGYNAFQSIKIDQPIITFDMRPYTIIPEGATGLVAYIEYKGSTGSGYYLALPSGCKTYTGLNSGVLSEFQIVADTQLSATDIEYDCNNHFNSALTDIVNNSPSSQGIFISGDTTYYGTAEDFALVDSITATVESATGKNVPSIYAAHGDSDGVDPYVNFANAHGADVTTDKLYYSKMINGYKYIFLATDDRANGKRVSAAQLEWLDAELADNEINNGGKHVFVLLHDVLSGSINMPYGPLDNTDEVCAVTSKYNNVLVFSGQNLFDISSEDMIFGGDESLPVVIGAGAVGFSRYYDGQAALSWDNSLASGFYVRVYEDKVLLLGRDFVNGKWVPEACYVLYNADMSLKITEAAIDMDETIALQDYIAYDKFRSLIVNSSDPEVLYFDDLGTIIPYSVGDTIPTEVMVSVLVQATDTKVITRMKLPVRVFDSIDRNYYIRGSFDNWTDGMVMDKSLDDDDLVTVTMDLIRGTYEFGLNNFEEWYEKDIVINDETGPEGIVLGTRIQRVPIKTKSSTEPSNITLKAMGGTYTFEYRIGTSTLNVYYTPFEDEGGVAGDSDLIDKITNNEPYVYASKTSYELGEAIVLTASGGVWVGIYEADVTNYAQTKSSYWFYTEDYNGTPVDLRTLAFNTGADVTIDPAFYTGEYKAVLFGTSNQSQVLDEIEFKVADAGYIKDGNNILSTDRTKYFYGEPIMVTGWTDRPDLEPWVALVKKGAEVNSSNLIYWHYIAEGSLDRRNVALDLVANSEKNTGKALAAGEYDLWLYRTNSYAYPVCKLTIEVVNGAGTISANKDTYGRYEDIIVTANYKNYTPGAWVGIYDESVLNGKTPTNSNGLKGWYYVDDQPGYSVVMQNLVLIDKDGDTVANEFTDTEAVPGNYSVYLFGDSGYSKIQDKTSFSISDNVTGKFSTGVYQMEKVYDGFANGRIILEIDPESYGYVGTADATVYWADADGKPLEGYTSLPKAYVDSTVVVMDMNSHTIIPEGAKSLVAYMSSYHDVMGTEGLRIDLPVGCATYTGLESGIVAKYNLITDTHLTSDDVTHYDNGLAKYHSWQQDTSNEYFAQVLKDISAISPDSMGIFINGDVSNNGFAEEFDQVDTIVDAVESELGVDLPDIYASMGNHDTYVGYNDNYVDFVNNHGGDITSDAPYYVKEVGGYKFIFLAGDNPDYYGRQTAAINSSEAELSAAQLEWLDAELKDNEENNEGKPVFIFLHQAIEDTVAGTLAGQDWDGLVNVDEFKAVVEKYDNVMLMGGHSHWLIDSYKNMYAGSSDLPVSVNLGSTSYSWTDYENSTSGTVMVAQGFYVQVYEDKVVFLGRDFTNEKWIPGACFVLYNEDVENTQTEPIKLYVDDTADATTYINNPLDRELTFASADPAIATVDANGQITATGVGETEIIVTAAATNTEVLKRTKVSVKVNPFAGAATSYYLKGDFNEWTDKNNMTQSREEDVVTATLELAQGIYKFKINSGDTWYGNGGEIKDTTETTSPGLGWEMKTTDGDCTLNAVGGTYTFNFNTRTRMLIITFERANEEETGEKTATIYVDYTNSSFTETPNIYIWDPESESVNQNIGPLWPGKELEGPNAEGYYYRTFKYNESYQFIINDGAGNQTADSIVHTEEEVYVTFTEGVEYKEGKPAKFWIDLNPDDDTSNIDLLYPELIDGIYYFFLPSGYNAKAAEFHKTEGTTLTITRIQIKDEGSTFNLLSGVNKNRTYVLGGDYSGKFMVKQSSNVASVYTYTNEMVPQGTGYGDHKDDYSTNGSIMVMNSDASVRLSTSELKKLKGRGNSSWQASNELIGKYAFNITLSEKAGLIDADTQSKKYSLVSYNADEARMRNMVIYDLAKAIGVDYVADYEPVDFYNNGRYIGTYLLTDKVEIGDPLVDITDLDKINEKTSDNNAAIYDGDVDAVIGWGGPAGVSGKDETSKPGFFKFVQNLDEPEQSKYEKSGFLLEFDLNERFADEVSGFISAKGQQIVCKYPEYATYNEMLFIMNKWAQAEELMYDEGTTYEELSEVIDVESFAKMYLIQELSKNLDAGSTSYYVYYDGGKLHAGVAWDYDWALGQYIQSGDSNLTVDKQTSGKFDAEANKLLNDAEGWWANSREIYPNTGVLNAQAALCQNDAFWNVVKAEWNELFYDTAMSFVVDRATSVSDLKGNFLEYYTQMSGSTAMDEFKWGIIASDPMASWGSTDTGDTHDDATVWLNNFYYDRLQWMNERLESSEYELATPTLKANKDAQKGEFYGLGEEIVLTATCSSSGELTYNFYDANGNLIESIKSSAGEVECRFSVAEEMEGDCKVVVTTENTTSETAQAQVKVTAKKFDFELGVEAPAEAPAGTTVTIGAKTNVDSEVLYYLYNEAGELVDASYEGIFDISSSPDEAGTTVKYTVKAEAKVNGLTYTASVDVAIKLISFDFTVSLVAPESVEAGMDIVLAAEAKSKSVVTYTFYDAVDHTVIGKNMLGSCIFETSKEFIGQTRSFYVVAETEAFGKLFTATSEVVDVVITAVTDVYNVTIYFKSTSTIGYKPMITTSGTVDDVKDQYMEKDIYICKNETETASYYWYKIDIEVSKKSPSIYFRILSSRYAMEVQGNLMITQDETYYFAVDNLNSGTELVNLTDVSEAERNWCESALHMVYDPKYDSEESLAKVTARVDLRYVGDTTADGKVNIRDATYIQKYLADLAMFNATDKEVADVDSDYKITIKDSTSIQKKLAGLL